MSNNVWLDSNELVITFRNGTHHVIEKYEGYESVFTGTYEACLEYCAKREHEYLESQF